MAGNSDLNYLVCQFGMPLYGVSSMLPFGGNYFWVNATTGSDGNTGGPQDPFATLTQALTAATAGNNDVIFLTGTYSPTATLTWSKNNTHLIGLTGGNYGTASISVANTAASSGAITPLVNVTATGCIFQNVSVLSGIAQATNQVAWAEAGGQNTYINCNINQCGAALAANAAGTRALTMASTNNTFQNCIIGGDAVARGTNANATVGLLAGAGSSKFQSCVFPMQSVIVGNTHVTALSNTISGYFLFDDCQFINDALMTNATNISVALAINATNGGAALLTPNSISLGATAIATSGTSTYIVGISTGGTDSTALAGIAVAAT